MPAPTGSYSDSIRVLFVCSANQCRSPMAKGLYRLRCAEAGCRPEVASAGFLTTGTPAPDEVLEVMSGWEVDLSRHRSRRLTPGLVAAADLVATMTRQQLLDVVQLAGDDWTRCYTLADLVRRVEAVGPLPTGGDPVGWLRRLHGERTRPGLLRLDLADDIGDPMGGRRQAFRRTAEELDGLVVRLVRILCPAPAWART